MADTISKTDLSQFIGTENYYPVFIGVLCTDGVHFFREAAKAYWLFSDAAVICRGFDKNEGFIVIKVIAKDNKAIVTYDDGNNNILYTQKYEYTDLEGEYTFYYVDKIILLPSEY